MGLIVRRDYTILNDDSAISQAVGRNPYEETGHEEKLEVSCSVESFAHTNQP